jgi:hypothetical protein
MERQTAFEALAIQLRLLKSSEPQQEQEERPRRSSGPNTVGRDCLSIFRLEYRKELHLTELDNNTKSNECMLIQRGGPC